MQLLGGGLTEVLDVVVKTGVCPGIFFGEGGRFTFSVQDRENGDLGAVAP